MSYGDPLICKQITKHILKRNLGTCFLFVCTVLARITQKAWAIKVKAEFQEWDTSLQGIDKTGPSDLIETMNDLAIALRGFLYLYGTAPSLVNDKKKHLLN